MMKKSTTIKKIRRLDVSICVPAYNEGNNIKKILDALLSQVTKRIKINKIIVVSSGSTDNTDDVVKKYAKKYKKCLLISQPARMGKAAAINAFLKTVNDEVVVIESADTIPRSHTIEKLCTPLIKDNKIGMTGGAPIPVNNPDTFLGYIIHTWWWFHRNIPRFGEIIAYRNILKDISPRTAVDEAFIQAKLVQMGYKIVHVDDAVVRNKGPETVADLIRQRRRIFNGHARLLQEQNIKIDNMTRSSIKLLLFKFRIENLKELIWFTGGLMLEVYARVLGHYDLTLKKVNPFVWDTAKTTKNLSPRRKFAEIVIISAYGDQNIGDAAILDITLTMLDKAIRKSARIHILSVNPSRTNINLRHKHSVETGYLPYGYAIRSDKNKIGNVKKIYRFMYIYIVTYIYLLFGYRVSRYAKSEVTDYIYRIKNCDAVISVGGGYIRTKSRYKDYFGLFLTLLPVHVAKRFNKKVLFLPMSFGNFASSHHERLAVKAMKDTSVLLREEISYKKLEQHSINIDMKPDLALFYPSVNSISTATKFKSNYIVLSAREWFEPVKQNYYENELSTFIRYLWDQYHIKTVFAPMTWNSIEDDDKRVAYRIKKLIKDDRIFQIAFLKKPREVQQIMSKAHLGICTRMHSAILASTVNTPYICISYEHKTAGVLRGLGLEKWNIDIRYVNANNLIQKYEQIRLLNNYNQFVSKLVKYKVRLGHSEREISGKISAVLNP